MEALPDEAPRGMARFSRELVRALVSQAPRGCDVEAVIPAVSAEEVEGLTLLLPGLSDVHRLPLGARELRTAWQHSFTSIRLDGMVHSPTPFAPLVKHNRLASPGNQTVVTFHDAAPWLFPEETGPRGAQVRAMAKRAQRYADAIVVPSHAVAEALTDHVALGDRVRVISGAVSSSLRLPSGVDEVVARLSLPPRYVLCVGSLAPHKNVESVFRAAASASFPPDVEVVFVGEASWGGRTVETAIFESGAPLGRIRHLPPVSDPDLAVLMSGASAVVVPSVHEGFGLVAVEAMHFGAPLIHSDAPALVEVADRAGVPVALAGDDFSERLASAIADTVDSPRLAEKLGIEGRDRSRAFSWLDSADRVWQLHADL